MRAWVACIVVFSGCVAPAPGAAGDAAAQETAIVVAAGAYPVLVSDATQVRIFEDPEEVAMYPCDGHLWGLDEPQSWYEVKIYNATGVAYYRAQQRMPAEADTPMDMTIALPPEGPWIVVANDWCARAVHMEFDRGAVDHLFPRPKAVVRFDELQVPVGAMGATKEFTVTPEIIRIDMPPTPKRIETPPASAGRATWHVTVGGHDIETHWVSVDYWGVSWGHSLLPNGMDMRLDLDRPSTGGAWSMETDFWVFDVERVGAAHFEHDWTNCRTGLNCDLIISPLYGK